MLIISSKGNKMNYKEKIKMFNDVFLPKTGEKILFLIDKPHDNIIDNKNWMDRRKMAISWLKSFKNIGKETGFTVDILKFNATGMHNAPIPQDTINTVRKYNLVIAMTEYSASSSLLPLCYDKVTNIRCASMPGVEKRMEETAFRANYADVQIYAEKIKKILTKAIAAKIIFSTGDNLFIDLRNRNGKADGGVCRESGQFINFPSGEGFISPYEGFGDEIKIFGESKTEGILPDNQQDDLIKYRIKKNKIVEVIGKGGNVKEMENFFKENNTRRNIAELGIGCNQKAVVTGNILEDEKVSGLHIAYGMSNHIGGKVKSDMHQDICFPKGLSVSAETLTIINEDGSNTELIKDAILKYDLLK
jgi:leucyl aminopeptidase (aminopeptidase T)